MKSKTNIIHLVIVGVLTIGFISGCKKAEDPKYKSTLCPRCYTILFKGLAAPKYWLGTRCKRCGQKLGVLGSAYGEMSPIIPFIDGSSYSSGPNDAQIAKWLAEAEAEEAAKAKAEEALIPEAPAEEEVAAP